jgi:hypothetical protein
MTALFFHFRRHIFPVNVLDLVFGMAREFDRIRTAQPAVAGIEVDTQTGRISAPIQYRFHPVDRICYRAMGLHKNGYTQIRG